MPVGGFCTDISTLTLLKCFEFQLPVFQYLIYVTFDSTLSDTVLHLKWLNLGICLKTTKLIINQLKRRLCKTILTFSSSVLIADGLSSNCTETML